MASKTFVSICVLVVVLNLISTSPASANWFGKRGNGDDLLGLLLKNNQQVAEGSFTSAESAMMAIQKIVARWNMERKLGMGAAQEKK